MSATKLLLSGVALASALFVFEPQSAGAADLPAYKAAPVVAPIYNWNGGYLGIVGGYGSGKSTQFDPEIETVAEELVEVVPEHGHGHGNYSVSGGTIGGTLGYNMQFDPSWLVGIEADASWANIRGSQVDCGLPVGTNNGCGSTLNAFETLRGRLGYVAGNFLIYGTGGLAVGNINAYSNIGGNPSGSNTLAGWTAGGGVEVQFAGNWSAKLEYLHVNFDADFVYNVEPGVREQVGLRMDMVRAGINYRFGAPVVARY
jgi:outer membrane immunogenic protein